MTQRFLSRTALALAALPLLLGAACGGSASGSSGGTATAPKTSTGVAEYLSLNLAALPSYATTWPVHYDGQVLAQDNQPADNVLTDKGATLGRVLFHDKRLSINDAVSCASCHQQPLGHSDSARLSQGVVPGSLTGAHSMRLGNARFYGPGAMFWDKRAPTLEFQTTQPVQSTVEMGWDAAHGGMVALITKMQGLAYYPELFKATYGDTTITEDRIQKALAQYVRAMASVHSRWDEAAALTYDPAAPGKGLGAPKPAFSAAENRGQQLYFAPKNAGGAGCAGCHQPPTFALAGNSLSNGLDAGEARVFKAPSLKNLSAAPGYMHDGRFATLEEVVDHYDHGVQDGPALDRRLRGPDGQPQRLGLSAEDRAALVAFLRTLEDGALNTDPRFSNPFKK